MLTQGEIAALIKGLAPALKEFVVHTAREEAGKANGAPARTGGGMTDLELLDGLADEVRQLLEEERVKTDAAISELRAEVAQSRAPGNGAGPTPRGFMGRGKALDAFLKYMDAVEDSVDKLRGEVAELRSAPEKALRDGGIWRSGRVYDRGNAVTDQGALWFCQADGATSRPGSSSEWRLAAKTRNRSE